MKTFKFTKATILLAVFASSLSILSCSQQNPQPKNLVWKKGDAKLPKEFSAAQFSTAEKSVEVSNDEIVTFVPQKWENTIVEGGYIQKVESKKSSNEAAELIFARAEYTFKPNKDLKIDKALLSEMHTKKKETKEKLKRLEHFKGDQFLSDVDVVIVNHDGIPTPSYAVDVLVKSQAKVIRHYFTSGLDPLKEEIVSNHFFDAQAWVITLNQDQNIQEVILKKLNDSQGIEGKNLTVISQSPENANSRNAPWKFSKEDPRFDQVQVYYFIEKAIDFLSVEGNFKIPTNVQVETSYGYPDKTNASFSYNNQIRLGVGDGKEFKGLSQDSTVVIHELGHVVVNLLARLPTQGEGGAINEGFCDFISATQLNNPNMGSNSYLNGPHMRTLENSLSYIDKDGGVYHDSQIISGTLWELRKKFGSAKSLQLALKTLIRLGPSNKFADFSLAVKEAGKSVLTVNEIEDLKKILKKRQWPDN